QWLPRDKVIPLGVDDTADKLRMMEGKKTSIRNYDPPEPSSRRSRFCRLQLH
ncbi:hypothetical protein M9458_018773, partial [Cirrhinus mrigala]